MSQQLPVRNKISIPRLREMKASGEKIAALTAYDATFARVLDEAGIEIILVGDSLGMVMQGHDSTLPVTVDDMVYHSEIDLERLEALAHGDADDRPAIYELRAPGAGAGDRGKNHERGALADS